MNVRKKLLPAKKKTILKNSRADGGNHTREQGYKALSLGRPRGISGKKSDHGGIAGQGASFRKGGGVKGTAIRKVPKDTYKRKKK